VKFTIFTLIVSIGFLTMTVRAIRKRVLGEQAAMIWLGVSICMVLLSATLPTHLLDHAAHFVGVAYPPELLLLLAALFLVVLVFHLSLVQAKLQARVTRLTQELGLLEAEAPDEPAEGLDRLPDLPRALIHPDDHTGQWS
jgi:hypothetical protein